MDKPPPNTPPTWHWYVIHIYPQQAAVAAAAAAAAVAVAVAVAMVDSPKPPPKLLWEKNGLSLQHATRRHVGQGVGRKKHAGERAWLCGREGVRV